MRISRIAVCDADQCTVVGSVLTQNTSFEIS